jgi:glycosyltransferase involved in cell wall biosynthesis
MNFSSQFCTIRAYPRPGSPSAAHAPFMRISILTPSWKSAAHIRGAIESVLSQRYPDFEHIIVDAGSTDGTVQILREYPHIKWISEPDNGQSDAMNKAFKLSSGEIIGNLNADDVYASNAFHAVAPRFERGADVVMGRVRIFQGENSEWINDPHTELADMLRWWERDAYCRNPVGFFYRRHVQDIVGLFDVENHNTMDLDFLLRARSHFRFERIPDELGTFRFVGDTKTARSQSHRDVVKKFAICEPYVSAQDADFQALYRKEVRRFIRRRKAHDWFRLLAKAFRHGHSMQRDEWRDLIFLLPDVFNNYSDRLVGKLRRPT